MNNRLPDIIEEVVRTIKKECAACGKIIFDQRVAAEGVINKENTLYNAIIELTEGKIYLNEDANFCLCKDHDDEGTFWMFGFCAQLNAEWSVIMSGHKFVPVFDKYFSLNSLGVICERCKINAMEISKFEEIIPCEPDDES